MQIRVRRYPNNRSQAIQRIGEDVLAFTVASSPMARFFDGQGDASRSSLPVGLLLSVGKAGLVALLAKFVIPLVAKQFNDMQGAGTLGGFTVWDALPYFVPLFALAVMAIVSVLQLRVMYPKWHINWNRALFLGYVLMGFGAICLLVFGSDESIVTPIVLLIGYSFIFGLAYGLY